MKSQKIIMRFAILLLFSLFFIASPSYADENGKIYHLTYSPQEPVALEDIILSIGIENPSDASRNYLLEVQMVKEGKIVDEDEFTFNLESSKGLFLTPKFTPTDIGQHEFVIRLYDKLKLEVFDTKIIKFNSISTIGPFDIIVEPLTSKIRPGLMLPTKVILENMGARGTDIEVKVSINCPDKMLAQSLTIFMPAVNKTERLLSLQTCDQEGLFTVQASIQVFNRSWVSSVSQFFINSSFIQMKIDAPEKISLKPGENFSFPVEVTNIGNQKILDLKFVVQRIPLAWQKTSPSSIIEVNPNETVVFLVNLEIPTDAESKSYEIRMTAAAEEVLERQISTLEVESLAVLPTSYPIEGTKITPYIIISLVILGTFVIFMYRNKIFKHKPQFPVYKPQPEISKPRMEILKKLKKQLMSDR